MIFPQVPPTETLLRLLLGSAKVVFNKDSPSLKARGDVYKEQERKHSKEIIAIPDPDHGGFSRGY
uniref:Bm54 n=1 Tax=Brugia malayi TaxID=6279 RepID=A0A1I9FZN8_BRUMA|nr:Bm54 [Brugia malayi]